MQSVKITFLTKLAEIFLLPSDLSLMVAHMGIADFFIKEEPILVLYKGILNWILLQANARMVVWYNSTLVKSMASYCLIEC